MRKRIKWSSIYEKCNHNKYSQITNISKECTLKSNIINFFNEYKITILILFVIILGILFYTFKTNLILILYTTLIFIALFAFAIYNSTFKLILKKDRLELNINFQKYDIENENLINIYLSRAKTNILFIPFYIYSLNIIYNNDEAMLISLPTIMLNKNNVIAFFESFSTKMIKDEEEEIEQKEKKSKQMIATILSIFFIVLILLILISFTIYSAKN